MPSKTKQKLNGKKLAQLLDVIRDRRSVKFLTRETECLERRLSKSLMRDGGRPSGANSQPWEICIIEDPERVAGSGFGHGKSGGPSQRAL